MCIHSQNYVEENQEKNISLKPKFEKHEDSLSTKNTNDRIPTITMENVHIEVAVVQDIENQETGNTKITEKVTFLTIFNNIYNLMTKFHTFVAENAVILIFSQVQLNVPKEQTQFHNGINFQFSAGTIVMKKTKKNEVCGGGNNLTGPYR